ncbi:hypothetical protein OHV13_11590 [Kitasatospora purpeofusca]|uniref:hypothetical protein n=1 Tax=Kitasatospora purpeofusca TaxID=67352 RepID=UPI003247E244
MDTIPQETSARLDLPEGDPFVVTAEDGRIVPTPASVVPDDRAWFWTPAWQAKENEVDEALAEGERGEVFHDGEAFLRSLAEEAGLDLREIERRADA